MNTAASSAIQKTLLFKSLAPAWAVGIFAVILALVALAWFFQIGMPPRWVKSLAVILRVAAAALVVFALTEPVRRVEEPIPQESLLIHLIDSSQSMGIEDCGGHSRVAAVDAEAGAKSPTRARLAETNKSLEFTFDEELASREGAEPLQAREKATDLAAAFRDLDFQVSGLPVAGVILYSDGVPTRGANPKAIVEAAGRLRVPVYAIGAAPAKPGSDVWVEKVEHPDEIVNQAAATVSALVGSRGMRGSQLEASLFEGEKLIQTEKIFPTADDQVVPVQFTLRPSSLGLGLYRVKVKADSRECYPWNNEEEFFVNVRKNKRRVLYIEGYPRYEYRFVRAAFEKDERFVVTSVIYAARDGSPSRQGVKDAAELQHGFPDTEEELFGYDVVVIGDIAAARFAPKQLECLRDFVRKRGGGLLFLGGNESFAPQGFGQTALGEALPFEFAAASGLEGEFRVVPTVQGIERRLFGPYETKAGGQPPWASLPAIKGLYPLSDLKPGAVALCEIETGNNPKPSVLAFQRYGRGAVVACGISATWPWQFQMPSEDQAFEAFWKQLILLLQEGLAGQLNLEAAPRIAGPGTEVVVRGAVLNAEYQVDPSAKVQIEIEAPDGTKSALAPGASDVEGFTFQQKWTPRIGGLHKVRAHAVPSKQAEALDRETAFLVKKEAPELKETHLNEPLLREIATMTGGQYLNLSDYSELPKLVKPREGALRRAKEDPLWDGVWLFSAILASLLGEWLIRRLGRMA